jgi:hypothetical protein
MPHNLTKTLCVRGLRECKRNLAGTARAEKSASLDVKSHRASMMRKNQLHQPQSATSIQQKAIAL